MKDTPVIKPFINDGKYYVYDTFTNTIFNITRKQFLEIQCLIDVGTEKYKTLEKNTPEYTDICLLIGKGYFKGNFIQTIDHPYTNIVDTLLDRNLNELILQVTKNCNFKCRYCLFTRENEIDRHHEKINMSWEIAKKSIDMLYRHSSDSKKIYISFYGGEPLMNFDLIKKVVEYSKDLFQTKKIHFSTTINGSLLTDEVVDFLVKHQISVGISLDGPAEIQNNHRKFYETGGDTFGVVYKNVMRLKAADEEYFNKHVTFQPVHMMDEDIKEVDAFFDEFNVPKNKVIVLNASTFGIDYIYSDVKLFNFDNQKLDFTSNSFEDERVVLGDKRKVKKVWHHNGPCVPGIRKLFVDTHGYFYPCEKVLENPANCIGNLDSGFDIKKIKDILNIGKLTEESCKNCWALRFCQLCVVDCLNVEESKLCSKTKCKSCGQQKSKTISFLKEYVKNR